MEVGMINNGPTMAAMHHLNAKIHPLMQPAVLGLVFDYLPKQSLLSCRRVTSLWTEGIIASRPLLPISINILRPLNGYYARFYPPTNVSALHELLSNEHATLNCENLILGPDVDFDNTSMISLFEDYGVNIKRLSITEYIEFHSTLIIFRECPNLRHLKMNPISIKSLKIPGSFQEMWDNSLPRLQSFSVTTTEGDFNHWDHDLGLVEDGRATLEELGLEIPFDFVILILTKIDTIKTFQVDNYYLELWSRIASRLGGLPEIIKRLKTVNLSFETLEPLFNGALVSIWNPQLNLKQLAADRLDVTSEEISTLLANLSRTLEELSLQNDTTQVLFWGEKNRIHLTFRNQMPALREIRIYSNRMTEISCSGLGNLTLFQQCPNLRIYESRQSKDIVKKEEDTWDKLFPPWSRSRSNQFTHGNLKELCIDWTLPRQEFLKEITRRFPLLRKLGLTLKGLMFQRLAEQLRESQILELEVTYCETDEGIDEFAAAITGFSTKDCKRYGRKNGKKTEMRKTHRSFSDWARLRELKIHYRVLKSVFGEEMCSLTNICEKHGFGKMKQLERLRLTNMEVHPMQVAKILNEVSLLTFDLLGGKVNDWNWEGTPEGRRVINQAAVDGIRTQFPFVSLKL